MLPARRKPKFGAARITTAGGLVARVQSRAIERVSSVNEVVIRKWWL